MNNMGFIQIIKWLIFGLLGLALIVPLYMDNNFMFPYVFPKVLAFRLIVEIAFVLYLFLAYAEKSYRPKLNWLFLVLALFVGQAFLASFFGINFYSSFWGDMERGEGLILWLHLLAFFLIIIGVVKTEKEWLGFFDYLLLIGFIMVLHSLAQAFFPDKIVSAGGQRVSAALGNASFLAAYMLFDFFLAFYMYFKRNYSALKFYYCFLALLFAGVIFLTSTRGAELGLIIALVFVSLLLVFSKSSAKSLKIGAGALIVVICIFGFLIFNFKNSKFVSSSPILSRIASISLTDQTARNRLVTWQASAVGVAQRPIFGVGLENFSYVFDKNFPAVIYEDEGSQVWFDRAHNMIFDRAATTGLPGLIIYLLFLFLPVIIFFKKWFRGNISQLPLVGMVFGFFIQDLFVFETITTYIILIFLWAYFARDFFEKRSFFKFNYGNIFYLGTFIFSFVFLWPVVDYVNLKPASANIQAAKALHLDSGSTSFFDIVKQYQVAIESKTYGVPEYRIQLIDFVGQKLAPLGEVVPNVIEAIKEIDSLVDEQIKDKPEDTMSYLVAMRHYNYTNMSLPGQRLERLDKALSYLPKAIDLSPTRPQIYREGALTYLYLYRAHKAENNKAEAEEAAENSEKLFIKSLELNPKVSESNISLIMCYLNINQPNKILQVFEQWDKNGAGYNSELVFDQLMDLASNNNSFEGLKIISLKLTQINPSNLYGWTNLAMAYAYLGQDQLAIETANKIIELSGGENADATGFVEKVKKGEYRKAAAEMKK